MDPFASREIGRTGVEVTQLGLGGAPLGELFERVAESRARATVAGAWRLGVRYFDTAPWYGHGLSEHRIGQVLRHQPRVDFVLSTKVGRVYHAPAPGEAYDGGPWAGGLAFVPRFDYTYDGILRSHEDSLQRLGLTRVELLLIHDLDLFYHQSEELVEGYYRELEGGGWRALEELKAAGLVKGVGAGINRTGTIPRFLERFDIDYFLVAMPYTLLDQEPLGDEFPRCEERGVGLVVGAPFASGILVTGAVEGAKHNYVDAAPEVMDKVGRIHTVCARHDVPLAAAALQMPLGHPAVAAVIPGAVSPRQVEANVAMMRARIPDELWQELKAEGLLRHDTPTP